MRNLLSLVLFCVVIGVSITCGSPEDDYCHKLERCDLLDEIDVDDVDECRSEVDISREEWVRHCSNSSEIKNRYDDILTCGSKVGCDDLKDEINGHDTGKCNREAKDFYDAIEEYCSSDDDDDDDGA